MNPPFAADASGPAEPERPIHPEVQAVLDMSPEQIEAGVAEFGRWFESQSPEWIAEMDEIGRMGSRKRTQP